MGNQVQDADQNIQSKEQNPISQPIQIQLKLKSTYQRIFILLLLVLVILVGYYNLSNKNSSSPKISNLIPTSIVSSKITEEMYSAPPPTNSVNLSEGVVNIAKQFLRDNATEYSLKLDLSDLKFLRVASGLGADNVHFQQLYQNIPVYGNYISVSVNKKGDRPPKVTSNYDKSLSILSVNPNISPNEAITMAQSLVTGKVQFSESIPYELVIYPQGRSGKFINYILAWEVFILTHEPEGNWDVFIDATTGNLLDKINRIIIN